MCSLIAGYQPNSQSLFAFAPYSLIPASSAICYCPRLTYLSFVHYLLVDSVERLSTAKAAAQEPVYLVTSVTQPVNSPSDRNINEFQNYRRKRHGTIRNAPLLVNAPITVHSLIITCQSPIAKCSRPSIAFSTLFWCAWNAAVSSIVYYGIAAYLQNMPWIQVLAYNKQQFLTRVPVWQKCTTNTYVGKERREVHRWSPLNIPWPMDVSIKRILTSPINRTLPPIGPIFVFAAHTRL